MTYYFLIDAGNSAIKLAICPCTADAGQGMIPVEFDSLPTPMGRDEKILLASLEQYLDRRALAAGDCKGVFCASVVPWLETTLKAVSQNLFGLPVRFALRDMPIPLRNPYATDQLGPDRLVAVYAARHMFPDDPQIICVDFGTATTFDCIYGHAYLGGLICPGVESAAEGLAAHTARLPKVVVNKDINITRVLGTSTKECMEYGFLQGFAAMADGLISRIAQSQYLNITPFPLVVATGGFASVLAPACSRITHVADNLVLRGLCFLAEGR